MRIVAGTYRGRRIHAPSGTVTRPTSDRVREALFSRIEATAGPFDGEWSALDLFAGSGALGIEALSRGAGHVTFVERDRSALRVLRSNLESLHLTGRSTVLSGDSFRLVSHAGLSGAPFSLLFLDPPYRIDESEVRKAIDRLVSLETLLLDALVVWEHSSSAHALWPEGFDDLGSRRYGDTAVTLGRAGRGKSC
ncbi:MAG: 16S rRNA (guanine(966)-N(2))-methyltransferase RsmD [Anaerosomatales bacterium]|nr:16S rRNA (guanine(966)-N(2))-methyltransferase RsmD [Anaerosomatales bacterium]MDT8433424.1 16S rRNA (guanine(966)-N(2))-methyltransferase RsmD [Anaerosomatales bacterium]